MKKRHLLPALVALGGAATAQERPNLLVIQTDEQTFRTLGCYRELMGEEQAFPWGRQAFVETPNLDRLAHEGAICTNYYASCPVSTPSRASMQTGLYPVATGAPINDMPLDPNLTTYAEQLRRAGYSTSYVGKWHLAGVPQVGYPYFEPGYNFGYTNRTFMYNDGHWKWYNVVGEPNQIKAYNISPKDKNSIYSTDYLVDMAVDVLAEEVKKDEPFYMMLSIPDPHSPDVAREPYLSEYRKLKYSAPSTMVTGEDSRPMWGREGFDVIGKPFDAEAVANYFGSVKCIDDNIAKIYEVLESCDKMDNTIIIFTSDHGDMLYEHSRINKGVPYESAARIPFMIRYPKKIKAGKIIENSYTTVDFAPTILGLMGVEQIEGEQHGVDDSAAFVSDKMVEKSDRVVYVTASPQNKWTMATDGRYKLVLSFLATPWLFDKVVDPNETRNFYSDPAYKEIAERLQEELVRQMKLYKEPALTLGYPFLYSADAKVKKFVPAKGHYKQNPLESMIIDMHKAVYRPLSK